MCLHYVMEVVNGKERCACQTFNSNLVAIQFNSSTNRFLPQRVLMLTSFKCVLSLQLNS